MARAVDTDERAAPEAHSPVVIGQGDYARGYTPGMSEEEMTMAHQDDRRVRFVEYCRELVRITKAKEEADRVVAAATAEAAELAEKWRVLEVKLLEFVGPNIRSRAASIDGKTVIVLHEEGLVITDDLADGMR